MDGFTLQARLPFAGGTPFGAAGPYELLLGRAHYAVDPRAACNAPITDLAHAPRERDGLVRFEGDVQILRPADPGAGNRRLFFDWGNRGNKRCLQYFNDARASNTPLDRRTCRQRLPDAARLQHRLGRLAGRPAARQWPGDPGCAGRAAGRQARSPARCGPSSSARRG